jgi:transposase-like protein
MKDDPIHSVIQQIKSKQIDPKQLSAEDRQRCVEFLRVEGYQVSEIAQILGRHERTIQRDLIQIRNANAVARDPRMLERVVGDVLQQAESSRALLRRIAREPGASAMERLMAERSVWKIARECVETLQSVGYLPKVPTGVVADIHQHIEFEQIAGYDELQNRLMRLKSVGDASGNDATIDRLIDEVQRGRLTMQVDHAASHIQDDTQ